MVFVPTDQRYFVREYYRAYQKANTNIPPVAASDPMGGSPGHSALSHVKAELKANTETIANVQMHRERRRRKVRDDRTVSTRANNRDIVAARLRGGLVQYMLKMGYSMEEALREATRAVAQMLASDRQEEDAASRQVYLTTVSGRPFVANTNHDLFRDILNISTKPRSYVDFEI